MRFKEWLVSAELEESKMLSNLAKGIMVGSLGVAAGMPFVSPPRVERPAAPDYYGMETPEALDLSERMKDQGRYYGKSRMERLKKMAEEGDEWAIRELPWPKNHKFHRLGRPFFRNEGPHPKGLFPLY